MCCSAGWRCCSSGSPSGALARPGPSWPASWAGCTPSPSPARPARSPRPPSSPPPNRAFFGPAGSPPAPNHRPTTDLTCENGETDSGGACSDTPRTPADARHRRSTHRFSDPVDLPTAEPGEDGGRQMFHPHADAHVAAEDSVTRFLEGTAPTTVSLCLDTGHIAYAGGDNRALVAKHPDRIGYVHLKSIDPDVLARVRAEGMSFADAVKHGAMVEPA